MIDEAVLERRLDDLERAVADLQQRLAAAPPSPNWLDHVMDSISDETAFLEALKFGQDFRRADRPPDDSTEQP